MKKENKLKDGKGSDASTCSPLKVLNLYAGLGGNRKNWGNVDVTSVELDPKIADVYAKQHPNDRLIVADAHQYLLDHADDYDFVWSSPPCQTHSKMMKATRHKKKRYSDMTLYQEIIFLQNFYKGKYVVENVVPYYTPLIEGKKIGRHMFWANFDFDDFYVEQPKNFINKCDTSGKKALMDWLGIHYDKNIYYGGNHCPAQILRNCVHPLVGEHVFNAFLEANDTALPPAERS